jgi:hypothetical protein
VWGKGSDDEMRKEREVGEGGFSRLRSFNNSEND